MHYLALATLVARRGSEELSVLAESQRWLGAALLTLAVPFAFGARVTVALWALEGAAAAWVGARRERLRIALAGLALQLVTGGYFLLHADELKHVIALANDVFVGGMLVAVAGLIGSHAASRLNPKAAPQFLAAAMLVWSGLVALRHRPQQIDVFVERPWRFAASLALVVLPLVAAEFAGKRLDWRVLRWAALLLPAVLALGAVAVFDLKRHPFADAAWISWLLAYAGHFVVLKRHEEDGENLWLDLRNALGFCVLAALSGWEASWQLKEWLPEIRLARMLGWGVVPALLLAAAHYAARLQTWPLATRRSAYLSVGSSPVVLALAARTLVLNADYTGAAGGWKFIPLIARERSSRYPVLIKKHETNLGLGATIRDGLYAAAELAADRDIIITMDADDTHTPGLILRMVRMISEGHDVVIASRYREGSRCVGVPLHRLALSHGASWLFRAVFPIRGVRDYTCGYRAYRAPVIRDAFARDREEFLDQGGFQCMVDILLKLSSMNLIFGEVPFILRYDQKEGGVRNVR